MDKPVREPWGSRGDEHRYYPVRIRLVTWADLGTVPDEYMNGCNAIAKWIEIQGDAHAHAYPRLGIYPAPLVTINGDTSRMPAYVQDAILEEWKIWVKHTTRRPS